MLFSTSLQTSRNTTYLFTVYTQTQLADNLNPIRRLATLANAAAENNQEEQDIEKGGAAAECFPMQSRTSVTVEDESGGGGTDDGEWLSRRVVKQSRRNMLNPLKKLSILYQNPLQSFKNPFPYPNQVLRRMNPIQRVKKFRPQNLPKSKANRFRLRKNKRNRCYKVCNLTQDIFKRG